MLTDEQKEEMTTPVIKAITGLEAWLYERIIEALKDVEFTQEYYLETIAAVNADYDEELKRAEIEIQNLLDDTYDELIRRFNKELMDDVYIPNNAEKLLPDIKYRDALIAILSAIRLQSHERFTEILQNATFYDKVAKRPIAVRDLTFNILDRTELQITFGEADLNKAIAKSVDFFGSIGMRSGIKGADGRMYRIDVLARKSVFEGMQKMTNAIADDNAKLLGTTCFEYDFHSHHRPSHGWGGMRYDELGESYPTQSDLFNSHGGGKDTDDNCKHFKFPVKPEWPEAYSKHELHDLESAEKSTKQWHGKDYTPYEVTQEQRAYERDLKRYRRQLNVMSKTKNADKYDKLKSKYSKKFKEYRQFSDYFDIKARPERVYADNLGAV